MVVFGIGLGTDNHNQVRFWIRLSLWVMVTICSRLHKLHDRGNQISCLTGNNEMGLGILLEGPRLPQGLLTDPVISHERGHG